MRPRPPTDTERCRAGRCSKHVETTTGLCFWHYLIESRDGQSPLLSLQTPADRISGLQGPKPKRKSRRRRNKSRPDDAGMPPGLPPSGPPPGPSPSPSPSPFSYVDRRVSATFSEVDCRSASASPAYQHSPSQIDDLMSTHVGPTPAAGTWSQPSRRKAGTDVAFVGPYRHMRRTHRSAAPYPYPPNPMFGSTSSAPPQPWSSSLSSFSFGAPTQVATMSIGAPTLLHQRLGDRWPASVLQHHLGWVKPLTGVPSTGRDDVQTPPPGSIVQPAPQWCHPPGQHTFVGLPFPSQGSSSSSNVVKYQPAAPSQTLDPNLPPRDDSPTGIAGPVTPPCRPSAPAPGEQRRGSLGHTIDPPNPAA